MKRTGFLLRAPGANQIADFPEHDVDFSGYAIGNHHLGTAASPKLFVRRGLSVKREVVRGVRGQSF